MNYGLFLIALGTSSLNSKCTFNTTPKNLNEYTLLRAALINQIGGRTVGTGFITSMRHLKFSFAHSNNQLNSNEPAIDFILFNV